MVELPQVRLHLRDILELRFRVNPALKLVGHHELPAEQRTAFAEMAADAQHYGILFSDVIPELGVQAVDHYTAHVVDSLWQPATMCHLIPDAVKAAGLVLDGVLQIQQNGSFTTGPAAYSVLFDRPFSGFTPADTISALSYDVLERSQMLLTADPREMSSWLYHAQTLPVTPQWARRLTGREQIEDFLGLGAGDALRQLLDDHFAPSEIPGWRSWQNLTVSQESADHLPTYKLYISPRPEALPQALALAVPAFMEAGVCTFKLGSDAFGLLRPDKLIAYFNDFSS